MAFLSIAVSVGCGLLVFGLLNRFDQHYPVAAVHAHTLTAPVPPSTSTPAQKPLPASSSAFTSSPAKPAVADANEPIARTHKELLALERLGRRNYVEFSIARSAALQPVGPIQIAFLAVDSKRTSVQVRILIDGHRVNLNRLKLYERVALPLNHSQSLDLVVTGARRSRITGYLSEPKSSDLHLAKFAPSRPVKVP